MSSTPRPLVYPCAAAILLALAGCTTTQTLRLNPGVEPEELRITCPEKIAQCERAATEACKGEYETLQRVEKQLDPRRDASMLSMTMESPGEGGELVIRCGKELPPLPLRRAEPAAPTSGDASQVPVLAPSPKTVETPSASAPAGGPEPAAATTPAPTASQPLEPAPAAETPAPSAPAPNEPGLPRLCQPGESRQCLGTGACLGKQVCDSGGLAFGECACP